MVLQKHYLTESGGAMPILRVAIDSGYASQEVYAWARQYGGGQTIVIKGDSRSPAPVSQPSPVDVGPQGKQLRYGVKVWPVNSGMIKEELFRWLRLERPTEESGTAHPSGYCHFPQYGEEYFRQITAEQLVTRVIKGYRRPEWQKTRDRNEALDCRVYARAAAAVYGIDRFQEEHWKALDEMLASLPRPGAPVVPKPPHAREVSRPPWIDKERTRNWFSK